MRLITAAARTDHMRAARGSTNEVLKVPAGRNSSVSRRCDADRSHGAVRPLLDIWALKSSTLERNSFRIGDLFALL